MQKVCSTRKIRDTVQFFSKRYEEIDRAFFFLSQESWFSHQDLFKYFGIHSDNRHYQAQNQILCQSRYISRASIRFLKKYGFDGVRLHDLRHTAATILAKRVPIKQVQAYLGHEDIQTTLGIYTHVLSEDSIATSKAMGDFLNGAGFVACSESCSESTDQTPDNVISFKPIMPEKLAVK